MEKLRIKSTFYTKGKSSATINENKKKNKINCRFIKQCFTYSNQIQMITIMKKIEKKTPTLGDREKTIEIGGSG